MAQTVAAEREAAQTAFTRGGITHLQRAENAIHDSEGNLHQDPLLLAQVALDLVQNTAASSSVRSMH